jgi:hypothetical protein
MPGNGKFTVRDSGPLEAHTMYSHEFVNRPIWTRAAGLCQAMMPRHIHPAA